MATPYETDVFNATRDQLSGGLLLEINGVTVQDVQLLGTYPDTEVVVAFKQGGAQYAKSFKLYNRSYPGGEEFPPVDVVATVIATNVAD